MFASITSIIRTVVATIALATVALAAQAGQYGQWSVAVGGPGYAVAASSRFAVPVQHVQSHVSNVSRVAYTGTYSGYSNVTYNTTRRNCIDRKIARIERREQQLQQKMRVLQQRKQHLRNVR